MDSLLVILISSYITFLNYLHNHPLKSFLVTKYFLGKETKLYLNVYRPIDDEEKKENFLSCTVYGCGETFPILALQHFIVPYLNTLKLALLLIMQHNIYIYINIFVNMSLCYFAYKNFSLEKQLFFHCSQLTHPLKCNLNNNRNSI